MRGQHAGPRRRAFLSGLTVAGTAGLLGLRPTRAAAEPPPETTMLRLVHQLPGMCVALGDFVGDERKIRQILLHLLSNAVKFTPDGGRIGVRAALDGEMARIAVSDAGIGIAPEDQAKIFEAFSQVGTDEVRKREGTGLGLSLTQKFVELHGGQMWVESEVGEGFTFTFTLPVRPWPTS